MGDSADATGTPTTAVAAAQAAPAAPPPIRTRGLTKRYGELTAVDELSLEIRAGEIFGLLGQNGAGKTTTILMLLGLTEPTAGKARVMGLDPARRPLEVKRQVGYLPDSVGFYGNMTGRQNLRYTARLNGLPKAEIEPRIDDAIAHVGLSGRADDRTDTYSRGMLQRLGIADALLKDPAILILDEPTTSIDPIGVVEILDLLRRLSRERGITILLSSHLLNQVQSVCDRVGIFAAGRLIGIGTVPELAARFMDATATIELAFEAPDDPGAAEAENARAAGIVGAIPGVNRLDRDDRAGQPWRIEVDREREAEVRRAIFAAATAEGLALSELRSVPATLDDIYRRALAERLSRVAA